ncbi:MAG TPA: hypothetical protein VG755_08920 [Nannocystaceae bacterium]|nr:hypothetical protein [Nannocystaceae bacterium]
MMRIASALLGTGVVLSGCPLDSEPIGQLMESSSGASDGETSTSSASAGMTSTTGTSAPDEDDDMGATTVERIDLAFPPMETGTTDPLPTCEDMPEIIDDACSVWAQDCPSCYRCTWLKEDAQAFPDANGQPICRLEPASPRAIGESCTIDFATGNDDCITGSTCWPPPASGFPSHCVEFCSGPELATATCDDPEMTCFGYGADVTIGCVPRCDPLDGLCPDGNTCIDITYDYACYPYAVGTTGAFEFCTSDWDCEPGLACVSESSTNGACEGSCCLPRCDMTDPGADAACAALDPSFACSTCSPITHPPGYEHVGECQQCP